MAGQDLNGIYILAYSDFSEKMRGTTYSVPTSHKFYDIPESISGNWIVYFHMLDDFSRNLSNTINVFGYNIERLRAWHAVIKSIDEEVRDQVLFEFVDNLFIVTMNTPHTMRDRFIFFGAQLSHMANRSLINPWLDDLPEDKNVKLEHLRKKAAKWSSGEAFVKKVEILNSSQYVIATRAYRNRFQHQLPSQELIGVAAYISRIKQNGKWNYNFMQHDKLDLSRVSDQLEGEFKLQVNAYAAYKKLVDEQLGKILGR